jgi:2-hydroxycyclohexanecarboxyl-CoA dehydrogenase
MPGSKPDGGTVKERATRTAIVTGGGSGIGLAVSERLAAGGQPVAIFDLNADGAKAAASAIEDAGGRAIGLQVDVTDRSGVEAAVAEVRRHLGPPTILVNNAGVAAFEDFLQIDINEWRRMIEVNLTGTFQCCQVVIPDMLAEGWGRIVNISSSSVHSGTRRQAHYVAAKSGLVGLTKCLALEFAPFGITVNTIPPGFIDTPLLRQADREGALDIEKVTAATPVGRPGRPEDIAAACAFLVSEDAGYVTGQIIGVNGGRNT